MTTKYNDEQLEQDIIRAIQARGLLEQMQEWDDENRKQQQQPTKQPIPLWSRMRKVIYPIAVAAAFVGVIVTVVPNSTWQSGYRMAQREYARWFHKQPVYQNSSEVLLALAAPDVEEVGARNHERQALGHEDPLLAAVAEMRLGHYRSAQALLDDVLSATAENDLQYNEIMADVDYLNALCDLGRGRRAKAYRQLQAIAQSDSRHNRQAAELLKYFK